MHWGSLLSPGSSDRPSSLTELTMNSSQKPNNNGISPSVLAFGASMLAVGLVLGYMLAPKQQTAPSAEPVAKAKVVNTTGGELRKLTEQEKKELTARKQPAAPAAPQAPADSPFLASKFTEAFNSPEQASSYRQAVGYMSKGNARAASGPLTQLEGSSKGSAWREPVLALLTEAQAATSRTADSRLNIATFKREYPDSEFMATVVLADARAFMQDGKRSPGAGGPGAITTQQADLYRQAIARFGEVASKWPSDTAASEALFNKAALQGELGEIEAAQTTANDLIARFPDYRNAPRALSNLGRMALAAGDSERAQAVYQKLIASYPKNRMAQGARGQLNSIRMVGKAGPELQIDEWLGSGPATIEALRGKPTLVVFWATWCPHCRREMPTLEATWNRYKSQGLQVIAVTKNSRGQTTEKVREYISANGLTFPIGVDAGGQTSRAYSVQGIPAAALLDKDGVVVMRDHPTRITDPTPSL